MSTATTSTSTSTSSTVKEERMIPKDRELIVEGQARMLYPKGLVFYNPVQEQNRDLSILMCTLFTERHVKRQEMKRYKKTLIQQQKQEKEEKKDINQLLQTYEQETDWRKMVNDKNNTQQKQQEKKKEEGIRILDALAASGLRSIRYWKEIPFIKQVVINDLDPAAVDLAKENITYNNVQDVLTTDIHGYGIKVQLGDATHVMYMSRRPPNLTTYTPTQKQQLDQYHIIDLDPYGSAAPFLDAAVQSVIHGGMLNITCTDMAALGGSHPETCYGRYGSMPITRAGYLQELALRILLHTLAITAAKYGRTIKPILSVGMHFYVRIFVEIHDNKAAVNDLSLNIGTVYQSTQCSSFHVIPHGQYGNVKQTIYHPTRAPKTPTCTETGGPFKVAGPIWTGPLHDPTVVQQAIQRLEEPNSKQKFKTQQPLHGLLISVSEELNTVPLYYKLPDLCKTIGCPSPPLTQFKAALVNAGYQVSGYHKEPLAIKTDAPSSTVWDIMRVWCQKHPPKKNKKKKNKDKRRQQSSLKTNQEKEENTHDNANETKETKSEKEEEKESQTNNNNEKEEEEKAPVLSVSEKILLIQPETNVDFTIPKDLQRRKKAQRFPQNPEANWGPKPRASGYKKRKVEDDNTQSAESEEQPSKTKSKTNEMK